MNRPPFPPQYPSQYVPPQGFQGRPGGAPGSIRSALVTQSQRRHALVRDAVNKLEAGFSELHYEASNVIAQIAQRNPQQRNQLEISLAASSSAKERVKRALDEALAADVALQDELQRWISGQPPSTYVPPQYQQPQQAWQQPPQAQQGQQAPQAPPLSPTLQEAQLGSFGPMQQNPAMMPNIPPGQLDMRDPRHAAAALLRAEQMPLGPQPMMHQQPMPMPVQAPMPMSMPMPVAPPPGPQYFGQPLPQNPVPVQMQYADPMQAGPPNMPVAPPVMQYTSPEAAQAAVQASHAAGVPVAAVTAAAAGPVAAASAAQNGAAGVGTAGVGT